VGDLILQVLLNLLLLSECLIASESHSDVLAMLLGQEINTGQDTYPFHILSLLQVSQSDISYVIILSHLCAQIVH